MTKTSTSLFRIPRRRSQPWRLRKKFVYFFISLICLYLFSRSYTQTDPPLLYSIKLLNQVEKWLPTELRPPFDAREIQLAFQYRQDHDLEAATWRWLHEILMLLLTEGNVLGCTEDQGLLIRESEIGEPILVAMNLFNSEALMPNLIFQLIRFVSLHKSDQIRISIYESNSTDETGAWLIFFSKLLGHLHVKHRIEVGGSLSQKAKDRIKFLAELRNAALVPMHQWKKWKATNVVFINDVFFCTQHVIRLLRHSADVACGMDFSFCMGCLTRRRQKAFMKRDLEERYHCPALLSSILPRFKPLLRWWRRGLDDEKAWEWQVPLVFYDRWVTVDLQGRNFINPPPYTLDPTAAAFLAQGYPVYVHSCWNGIVSLAAEPFYKNLRFRTMYPEECQASECFFICHDFSLLGFERILMDPGVRVGYEFRQSTELYNADIVEGVPFRPWYSDMTSVSDMPFRPHPNRMQCCVLGDGKQVDFDSDCRIFDYSGLNCTGRAMDLTESCTPSVISD